MREHAELGYRLLEGLGVSPVDRWIRHHHEWWDGSGYPLGLAGEDIPLGSRIILVADAFDAMTSDRVYRAAGARREARGRAAPPLLDAVRRARGRRAGAASAPRPAELASTTAQASRPDVPGARRPDRRRASACCWAAASARLAELRLRAQWLFFAAIGLQLIAYPSRSSPSSAGDGVATALQVASYGCLVAVTLVNLRLTGMAIAGAGMLCNLAAILANGGHMPGAALGAGRAPA